MKIQGTVLLNIGGSRNQYDYVPAVLRQTVLEPQIINLSLQVVAISCGLINV